METNETTVLLPMLLTTTEALAYLRVSRDTLDKLYKAGQVRRTMVGGCVRYKASELQRYLDRKTVAAKG